MTTIYTALPDGPITIRVEPEERQRFLTPREFLARLTMPQKLAIRMAAQSDAALAVWMDELVASTEVDLDHPDTVAGLDAMRAAGLLTAAHVAAIRGLA
jgi:hypothetical protein